LLYCPYDIIAFRADWFSSPKIIHQVEKNEMVGELIQMGEMKGVYRVLVGNLRKRDHLEDPGINRRIILRWIFRKLDGAGMDWNDLAQDRDRW
jgi:hypothetical protein